MEPSELQLKKAILGGEAGLQNQEFRRTIEEKWGIKAIDGNFGVSDVLSAFGSECEFRNGLHFHGQGIIHPELIDPNTGKPLNIQTGQVGEFVYTNLNREAQPLIRFRSHDMVEIVGTDKCQCGRTSFRFKVLGRSDDMIVVRGINVFPTAIASVISEFSDLLTGEFEIVLNTPPPYDYLPIRMECRCDLPEKLMNDTVDKLKRMIKEKLNFTAEIIIIPKGSISRTDGKAKRIIKNF
jgi:phenylacetate-CoA ligase